MSKARRYGARKCETSISPYELHKLPGYTINLWPGLRGLANSQCLLLGEAPVKKLTAYLTTL